MAQIDERMSLLRRRGSDSTGKVNMVELFFDLVFVFAVTQLSHTLLEDLTLGGVAEVALLWLAVWWVWIYTTWVTNWLDPQHFPVRIAVFAMMIVGLLLSVSIPEAFADRGWLFASAYVAMQLGRTLFFLWATRGESAAIIRNFQRILCWLSLSAVFWLIGGFIEARERMIWWSLAFAIEFISPAIYFWVPGLGRSKFADWDVDGSHLAERCALFIIIALGESLLVTGATFAELDWNLDTGAGFLLAILSAILMWWIYFDTGAERAHHRIRHANDPGRQARTAYTYLHAPIIAGIIVSAVADELVLAHPDHASTEQIAATLGGPLLFLAGVAMFKWATSDRRFPPLSHVAGIFLFVLLTPLVISLHASPVIATTAATAVLAIVAVWETAALKNTAPLQG